MVCGALAVGVAVPIAMTACRCLVDSRRRSCGFQALAAQAGRLIDRLAGILEPLTTWGYRRRSLSRMRRAGVSGWTAGHLAATQVLSALTMILIMVAVCWITAPGAQDSAVFYNDWRGGVLAGCVIAGWVMPAVWLRQRRLARIQEIGRGMPTFLDLLCLGLDCGMNLQASVQLALEHLPEGALRAEWHQMLLDMRSGAGRAEALRHLSDRVDVPSIRQLVSTLAQGERAGLGMTRILGDFARHERARRMLLAEKQAMQAPVRMLIPLALCIFPCTFLILGFPVLVIFTDLSP